ncbi:MAG: cupin domain-containing protein [Spirochaetota bacterium]
MELAVPFNMNRSEKLIIQEHLQPWLASPNKNVFRKPFEREKEESGQVTSLVRYEPGSEFSEHTHPLGEEIFVWEGEFADEHGRYPAGTYLRNPSGSSHKPFSEVGCKLFVKLNQFASDDLKRVVIDTTRSDWFPGFGMLRVMPLHEHGTHNAALVHWPPGATFQPHKHWGGEEIFVLQGTFQDEYGNYPQGTYLRSPHLSMHNPFSEKGCTILVKVGHMQ